jgi:hypothetical protein
MSIWGDARRGLEYAQALANNALERREASLAGDPILPDRLKVEDLEDRYWESATTIRKLIKLARTEAYGERGQSARYHYLARRRQLAQQPARICAEPGCDKPLPPESRRNRRFCNEHQSGAARARRHRHRPIADR